MRFCSILDQSCRQEVVFVLAPCSREDSGVLELCLWEVECDGGFPLALAVLVTLHGLHVSLYRGRLYSSTDLAMMR
jgi:hypothetical protein